MKNASTAWGEIVNDIYYIVFYYIFFYFLKIIYSIRLVPGSSPGQPIILNILKSYVYKYELVNSFHLFKQKKWINRDI